MAQIFTQLQRSRTKSTRLKTTLILHYYDFHPRAFFFHIYIYKLKLANRNLQRKNSGVLISSQVLNDVIENVTETIEF